MGRRLVGTVVVREPATNAVKVLAAGDDVPVWAVSQITNPDLWADEPAESGEVKEPPRSGAGSGKDAWTAYAAGLGVEHDEGATRDEIIAAVDAFNE